MKNHTLALLGMLVVVLMALALAAPASADEEGNVLRVGPGQEYETIQAAVDAAQPGSRILVYSRSRVYPERYEESVTVTTNNLQIIAQGSNVTVSPPVAKPGFDVNADHVTVRGFEISGAVCAPGITFQGSHNTFADNTIWFFQGPCDPTAIRCVDPDGGSDYNTIESNSLSGAAGTGLIYGIFVSASSDALNEGNVIKNNSIVDVDSLGIYVGNGTGFQISGNTFEHIHIGDCILVEASNNAHQGHHRILKNKMFSCAGAGISLYALPGTVLANNRISANEINTCGQDCLALKAGSGAALTQNYVMSNTVGASLSANGVYLSADQDAAVNDNMILDNVVYGNFIDGISLSAGSDHNRILNNEVDTNHNVGVAIAGDNNLIVGNHIWNNKVSDLEDTGVNNRWYNNTVSD